MSIVLIWIYFILQANKIVIKEKLTVRLITARHRKTPQDTARHPQDTARHCKTATRHCKGPQERRMQGYYRYSGVWWWWWWWGGGGGVVTTFFGRTFLLHFCTNCEKTKLGKQIFLWTFFFVMSQKKCHNFFPRFVFSQFVQKCNKNVIPKNFVTTPPPPPPHHHHHHTPEYL